MDDRRTRPPLLALLLAVIAALMLAAPALAAPTKDLTVDPGATQAASGFTDLHGMTYAQAKARLDQLSQITLPARIPGLERLAASGVTVDSNDSGHALSLSGSATVLGHHADLLVTAVWPDDASTAPVLAVAAKTSDVSLSQLNPRWDDTYGDVRLSTVRLAVASADEDIDPGALPAAARDFYSAPTHLTGGVNLAGDLTLSGRLADAFGYAGYSGDVHVEGSLAASAAALFGHATDAQLGDLDVKATLGKSPSAPAWIADRTSTYELALTGGHPSLSVDEDVTLAIDGTTNHFTGHVAIAADGTVAGDLDLVGPLDAPFGLDAAHLSNVRLHLGLDGGALEFTAGGLHVTASLDRDHANFTADGSPEPKLSQIVSLFGDLHPVGSAVSPELADLSLDSVGVSVRFGGQPKTLALTAATTFQGVRSDLLVSFRSGRGFTLGLKAQGPVDLSRLVPSAPAVNVHLSSAAMVLSSQDGVSVDKLTDDEFTFYKSLYGCADAATPAECPRFTTLDATSGLQLLASFDLDDSIAQEAGKIGIQTGGHALLEGRIPVLGGHDFALRASLGDFRFDKTPDWFDHGSAALEIGADGLRFDGDLGVKIQRKGDEWKTRCDHGVVEHDACYDLLDFTISAGVSVHPTPRITLTGKLTTDNPWVDAFGQDWLQISRVALELGVTMGPGGPEVTMGFQGDVKVGSKDVAAALKVALTTIEAPPFVSVDLIGFSAASHAGLSLSDLVWLNDKITGTHLSTSNLPEVSLRNLDLQYSRENDPDLCLTQGFHFNADLYVGSHLPAVDPGTDDPNGCRRLETDPKTDPGEHNTCLDHQSEGCMASVYGRFDAGGIVAGGQLSGFHLGPISLDDSSLALALTPSEQSLSLHGGATIGSDAYIFARGSADLALSSAGFDFAGDATLFGGSTHGYLQAHSEFSLSHPAFTVKAWLRDDADAAISSDLGASLRQAQPAITALGQVLNVIQGGGSVQNVRDLPTLLRNAGATVPPQVDDMARMVGDIQDKAQNHVDLTLGTLLNGFSYGVDGSKGWWTPDCLGHKDDHGHCWGISVPSRCMNVVVDGTCYFTPPATVTVGGICSALGVGNCSWSGLMAYVRPALSGAFTRATGLQFSDSSLSALMNGFAGAAGSLVDVDCAYFSADGSQLAKGELNIALAARLRVFGRTLQFGNSWDFGAHGGNPGTVLKNLLGTVLSPSSGTCPAFPAGHEQPAAVDAGATLGTGDVTSADEGGTSTLTATFGAPAVHYPPVKVDWGDGTTAVIPGGESRTVTATHSYAEGGAPVTVYTVTAKVEDSGGSAKVLSAKVRNVAPTLVAAAATPTTPSEGAPVTVAGTFTDPGATDAHTVQINWGDGSAPVPFTFAPGTRRFAIGHRYVNDGAYHATVTVGDDDGGSTRGSVAITVTNAAPTDVRMKDPGTTAGAQASYPVYFADAGTLDVHTVHVDWGDGSSPVDVQLPAGTTHVDLPHAFAAAGSYSAHVTVTDERGAQGQAAASLTVR
jgi:hypothetical protein